MPEKLSNEQLKLMDAYWRAAYTKQAIRDALIDHKEYIYEHGEDAPEISGWRWGEHKSTAGQTSSTESDNL